MTAMRWRYVPAAGIDAEVDVGQRRVRVRVDGTAGMPVVLCSPLDANLEYWNPLVEVLSASAIVIRYDRPVEPGHDLVRDGQDLVALLETLPEHLPVAGPYVVVGASIGAVVARLAALSAPHLVAALVLVDGSLECFDGHPDVPQPWLDRWGADDPADAVERIERASANELLSAAGHLAPLGEMPLRALIATKKDWGGFGHDRAVTDALDRVWLAGTRLVTCTSLYGVLVAADTDHHIACEDPQLVAAQIGAVLPRVPAPDPPVTHEGVRAASHWWANQLRHGDADSGLEPLPTDSDPVTPQGRAFAAVAADENGADAAADIPDSFDPHQLTETLYEDAMRCYAAGIPQALGGLHPSLEFGAVGVSIGVGTEPDEVLMRAMAEAGLPSRLLPMRHRTAVMPAYTVAYRRGTAPQVLWRHPTRPMPACPGDPGQACALSVFHPGDHQPDPGTGIAANVDASTRDDEL